MNDRQKRKMIREGMRPDKIGQLTDRYLSDLKQEDMTLAEAKAVARRMAYILHESEKHGPQTLLSEIHLRDR